MQCACSFDQVGLSVIKKPKKLQSKYSFSHFIALGARFGSDL